MRNVIPVCAVVFIVTLVTACSPTVVSRDSGQTIAQAQDQPMDGPKKRIAVMPFEMKAGRGSAAVGRGMSDMLTDALVNSGRFIVLERETLKDVVAEQDLGRSGRVRKESAPEVGAIEGAQLLIRGSVVQFEPECSGGTLTVVGLKQACVSIAMRIIDARTGQVLNSTTVDGSAVTAGGGLTLNIPYSPLPVGLGGWSKTPMERAIRNCIDSAVQHILKTKT
jgi:curli biogenesis system outer membrane secretion channel CsgG